MNKSKTIATFVLFALTSQAQAQLLMGTIKGAKVYDAVVSYSPDGYVINARTKELSINDDGTFTFDMDLDGDYADVEILLGDDMVGAHLVKGKTVKMNLVKTSGGYKVVYLGAESKLNIFVNAMKHAYDSMKYWSPDQSKVKSNAEYLALLEEENKKVQALLPTIKDKKLNAYYTKLADYTYRWTRLRILMDDYENRKGEDYHNDPVFKSLLADVDLNDPIAYQSNLTLTKLFADVSFPFCTTEQGCRKMMNLIDEKITNPTIRRSMIQMAAQNYFLYGEGDDNSENFIKDIKAWAGKDVDVLHEMIRQFLDKRASQKATQVGTKAPDITLTDRDGKKRQLLDIVKGKLTYIDVWATWCGPCKREIPFLAKLVEKYKDNDKIQFISISVDENVNAWKKMIETDKPAWQQYNINGEVNAEFSKQWGITGIPRFIMIDGSGNIVASDATRPSDDATSKSIYELIDNK